MRHCLILGAVLLAGADADRPKGEVVVYKTPQAVFEAAFAAQKKGDDRTFIGCLAPWTQRKMAAAVAFSGLHQQFAAQGPKGEKYKEQFKMILAVLDKHGLSHDVTKKFEGRLGKEKEQEAIIRELGGLIKEPVAFFGDLQEAYSRTEPFNRKRDLPAVEAKLTDVKIDGDKATGTAILKVDGKEVKHPADFIKVGGGWRLAPEREPAGGPGGK
jgi:hypothetical protein